MNEHTLPYLTIILIYMKKSLVSVYHSSLVDGWWRGCVAGRERPSIQLIELSVTRAWISTRFACGWSSSSGTRLAGSLSCRCWTVQGWDDDGTIVPRRGWPTLENDNPKPEPPGVGLLGVYVNRLSFEKLFRKGRIGTACNRCVCAYALLNYYFARKLWRKRRTCEVFHLQSEQRQHLVLRDNNVITIKYSVTVYIDAKSSGKSWLPTTSARTFKHVERKIGLEKKKPKGFFDFTPFVWGYQC